MSMISSQIDALRKAAQNYRDLGKHEAEQMLLDAATQDAEHDESMAWDRVRKAEAENAKLREQVERLHADQAHWELGNCPSCPNVADLQEALEQNAKLRELAHLVAEYVSADQCEGCVTKRACNAGELDMCWIRKAILEKLRELGIEVD